MNALDYIEDIFSQLKQTLSAPDTGKVYLKAIAKTWQLIQQLTKLIFLLALLSIAFVIWIWNLSFKSGYNLRKKLETESTSPQSLLKEAFQLLLSLLQGVVDWADSQFSPKHLGQATTQVILPTPANKLIPPAKTQTTIASTNIQQSQ